MKKWLLLTMALVCALGFAALGVWQVERLAWKRDLIARVEARIHAAPAALPADFTRADEYRRVRLTGSFLHDRETLVKAVTEHGEGYWLVTPLKTPHGIVLVNRGFVPLDKAKLRQWWCGPEQEQATVTGLLRVTEPGGAFLRTNDPAGNRWFSRDVAAIAKAKGLGNVAPFFVDADATPNPGGYPIGGLTMVRFSNNHLIYAITWFALAGLSAAGAALVLRRPKTA